MLDSAIPRTSNEYFIKLIKTNIMSTTQAPPANNGTTLNIFIGKNKEEQIENLQDIKDSMADVLIQSLSEDCMINEKTAMQLSAIYLLADRQIRKLKSNRHKD